MERSANRLPFDLLSLRRALAAYGRLPADDRLLVCRTDHPHISGAYWYAIRASAKHAWTPGETPFDHTAVEALAENEMIDV